MTTIKKSIEQALAIESNAPYSIISASPGSGKTHVLTHKIAHNHKQYNYKQQIAFTYTNVAAETIHGRLLKLLPNTENIWIGTIHSFCLEWILKPYAGLITELKNGFTVIDPYLKSQWINELIKVQSLSLKYGQSITTTYGLDGQTIIPAWAIGQNLTKFKSIISSYHTKLIMEKYIDFDQILFLTYKHLKDNSSFTYNVAKIIEHIYVDEYQDTQLLQYEIIKLLSQQNNTNLTFVGDINQGIFLEIGAYKMTEAEIGPYFNKVFTSFKLTGCYRSTQTIIDSYSKYQNHPIRIQSECSHKTHPSVIEILGTSTDNDTASKVMNVILKETQSGILPENICITAPQGWPLQSLITNLKKETRLDHLNFSSQGISPVYSYNKENIFYNLVRLYAIEINMKNYDKRQFWAKKIIDLLSSEYQQEHLHHNYCKFLLNDLNYLDLSSQTLYDGINILANTLYKALNIDKKSSIKLEEHYESFLSETKKKHKEIIPDFNIIFRYYSSASNAITVDNIHQIKGMEYDVVIGINLDSGKIPHRNALPELAEYTGKNLIYVFMSRARKNLYLLYSARDGVSPLIKKFGV